MPFVPTNAPGFYSAMMRSFKEERDFIFSQMLHSINTFDNNTVPVTETEKIYLNKTKLVSGRCTIIDDIFIFCSNLDVILIYLECVCKVFLKYRVRFRIKKCDFLKNRVEYVVHDVTKAGNCPAQSKLYLINDCILTPKGKSLLYFIGIVNLYHFYDPYFEIQLKLLRKFIKKYYGKPIPLVEWTPQLITLFSELKYCATLYPLLNRFDPDKPTFLNIDWSS